MIGQHNPNLFQPLADHRAAIGTELNQITLNSRKEQCDTVESCLSNTKNISVKLNDLRTAQDHGVSEFSRGVLNVLGGVFALVALAAIQLVCLPTIIIPGGCKLATGSMFLPGFSEMASVVERGASRVANAFKNRESLEEKVQTTTAELNDELANLPNNLTNVSEIKKSVASIKQHITGIRELERENGIKVVESLPTIIDGTVEAPRFEQLMAMDAEKFKFVKLVNELTSMLSSVTGLSDDIEDSLMQQVLDQADEEIDFNEIAKSSLEAEVQVEENLVEENLLDVSGEEVDLTDNESLNASENDSEFGSDFEINVEISTLKKEAEATIESANSESSTETK